MLHMVPRDSNAASRNAGVGISQAMTRIMQQRLHEVWQQPEALGVTP
jgi:hypothetical protein